MLISFARKVYLESSDGKIFEEEESVAVMSPTIKNMIKDYGADKIITIPNVSGEILSRALDYCRRKHFQCIAACSMADLKKIKAWDDYQFVQVDNRTLRNLDKAARFLALQSLRDLISQTLKDRTQATSRLPLRLNLKSSDGEILNVEKSVAVMLPTIKNMIEKDRANRIIPIPDVSGEILFKVIDYCWRKKHLESTAAASLVDQKEIKPWEYEFLRVDKSTLHALNKASTVLKINRLMELTFQTLIKDMMAPGIAPQEVLKKTRIEKYYTKEEEEERRKTYSIPSDRPVEIDFLKNFGKESTKAEEKAWGKRKKHLTGLG